jgi:hypothetical protein
LGESERGVPEHVDQRRMVAAQDAIRVEVQVAPLESATGPYVDANDVFDEVRLVRGADHHAGANLASGDTKHVGGGRRPGGGEGLVRHTEDIATRECIVKNLTKVLRPKSDRGDLDG